MISLKKIFFLILLIIFSFSFCSLFGPDLGPKPKLRYNAKLFPHFLKKNLGSQNWRKEIIYFVLIDRFYNGNTSNDQVYNDIVQSGWDYKKNPKLLKRFWGGDLKGVEKKLDYLKSLGVTTIWLSPFFRNEPTDQGGWWPYHGYHVLDFYQVDPRFGTLADLKELMRKAHQMGLKIIFDMPFNQLSPHHPWARPKNSPLAEKYYGWFNHNPPIADWQNQQEIENGELYGLPDLNQNNPHVYKYLLDVAKYWIAETSPDGFRLDAVKHIPKSFWKKFNKDIKDFAGKKFLLLGEVFDGRPEYVSAYANLGFNALFDIPGYYSINQVFAKGGNFRYLSKHLQSNSLYQKQVLLSPLIDNHDVERFLYQANPAGSKKYFPLAVKKQNMALAYILTSGGVPMIYYGTEFLMQGGPTKNEKTGEGTDYLNREPIEWEQLKRNYRLKRNWKIIQKLITLHKTYPSLFSDTLVEQYKDFSTYAYMKFTNPQDIEFTAFQGLSYMTKKVRNLFKEALIVFNSSTNAENVSFLIDYDIFPVNTVIKDLLSGRTARISRNYFRARLPALSVSIFLNPRPASPKKYIKFYKTLSKRKAFVKYTEKYSSDIRLIRFQYLAAANIKSVYIAGDFNHWNAKEYKMNLVEEKRKNGKVLSRLFEIKVPLRKKNLYAYKFILNNSKWIFDPTAKKKRLDPYGDYESLIEVP